MTHESAPALRIAIVAPYDLSAAGGINTQIRTQARALRALGHTAVIFGAASNGVESGERTFGRTLRVSFGGTESGLGVDPRAFRTIRRAMREPYDVVHVHEPMVPLVPWLSVLCSRAPVVGTFHVHREQGHGFYRAWSWALERIAQRLRVRVAVSDAARRTIAAHFPGRYEIVPNAIDADRFRVPQDAPSALADDRPHVLYVGRLEPRKGVDHLVRAVARVRRRIPTVQLTVAGEGSARDGLQRLSDDVRAPVQFVGRVSDAALPAYMQAARVVCAPAVGGESFGIVLLEAMAAGTPVIASRIEGYEALAGPSAAATLVAPGSVDAIADAIESLFESAYERRVLIERGAALAREHDWRSIGPRLVAIYRRALNDS
jgi:phosphatidylinositol alpha-mannosyltransferase